MDNKAIIQKFIGKTRHYLITERGKTEKNASDLEFYQAFSQAVREEIMVNWLATKQTHAQFDHRLLCYLSMEYMPGKIVKQVTENLRIMPFLQGVFTQMGRSLSSILQLEEEVSIGNGGLGRLASCFLESLASMHMPAIAYGLRYQYGIFEQEIFCGTQIEKPECWLLHDNPWELRQDGDAVHIYLEGTFTPREDKARQGKYQLRNAQELRAIPYDFPIVGYKIDPNFSVLTLRLWSTKESPRNFQLQKYNAGDIGWAGENNALTDVLYPNDNHEIGKSTRLKQEFLLVSASLQDLMKQYEKSKKPWRLFSERIAIQMNDTHPALAVVELMRLLMKRGFSWERAKKTTLECCYYTNHSLLKEALEEWNASRMQQILPEQYHIIEKLNSSHPLAQPIISNNQINMAHLAISCSQKVNGVSKLHTKLLKTQVFPQLAKQFPKFLSITNGVSHRKWLVGINPTLTEFISKRIGDKWITDFKAISKLKPFAKDPESQQAFLKIKNGHKQTFLERFNKSWVDKQGACEENGHIPLDTAALFDIQAKRIHEYKRQIMNALHAIILYLELKEDPNCRIPRNIFFAGKAFPGYEMAKHTIRLIDCIAKKINSDKKTNNKLRIFFVANYNVSQAEWMIPAADLSQQISSVGFEASGTGNMKFAMNGALTLASEDGANIEMASSAHASWPFKIKTKNHKAYNPIEFYNQNRLVKMCVDALKSGLFAELAPEKYALSAIYQHLLVGSNSTYGDAFHILQDLPAYYKIQKNVEALYQQPSLWAQTAIENIAAMGPFSSDNAIKQYTKMWGLSPLAPLPKHLKVIQEEYDSLDQCRISYPN